MIDRGMLREGMTVHSADGAKLGKIQSCGDDAFIIEKGFFLPTDYVCRYVDVASVEGDEVRLAVGKDEFRRREIGDDDDATTADTGSLAASEASAEPWREERLGASGRDLREGELRDRDLTRRDPDDEHA